MTNTCPICDTGELVPALVDETISYGGARLVVTGVEISRCPVCEGEVVLPAQAKVNDRLFSDAKRRHDNLLTSQEIRDLRAELGLTQAAAATVFGGGANAFSKYERGEVIQSRPMDLLMRLALELPQVRAKLIPSPCRSERTRWTSFETEEAPFEYRIVAATRIPSGLLTGFSHSSGSANDSTWVNDGMYSYGSC